LVAHTPEFEILNHTRTLKFCKFEIEAPFPPLQHERQQLRGNTRQGNTHEMNDQILKMKFCAVVHNIGIRAFWDKLFWSGAVVGEMTTGEH
jgi:hypothetical protein